MISYLVLPNYLLCYISYLDIIHLEDILTKWSYDFIKKTLKKMYILFSHSFRLFNLTLLRWKKIKLYFPEYIIRLVIIRNSSFATQVMTSLLFSIPHSYCQYQRAEILLNMPSFIYPSIVLVFINSTVI